MNMSDRKIRVKVLSRVSEKEWGRYFPNQDGIWGNCLFLFGTDERSYDWLVVYNDLPARAGERFTLNEEVLACPGSNTLLVTYEPSNVKVYGREYTSQFGHVLTSQEEWALPHPHRIYSQPALNWYYGVSPGRIINWQELKALKPDKPRLISTVCASKQHETKVHVQRNRLIEMLKPRLPELEIFGRGVRPVDDKAEAIDEFKYHIAVENFIGRHHWTEKLSDCFLGFALPIYAGCTNTEDYFPEESFMQIDITNTEESVDIINKEIRDNTYESRFPAILEARRRVLEEYNFFAVVARIIEDRHQTGNAANTTIRSRRAVLSNSVLTALNHVIFKSYVKARHFLKKNGQDLQEDQNNKF